MRLYSRISAAVLSAVVLISSLYVAAYADTSEHPDNISQDYFTGDGMNSKFKATELDETEETEAVAETGKIIDKQTSKPEISGNNDSQTVNPEAADRTEVQTGMAEISCQSNGNTDKTESVNMDDGHLSNKNEDSNINESGSETDIPRYENTDYILISENKPGDVQDVSENNSNSILYTAENCAFKEADGITLQYFAGTEWTDFYGRTDVLDHIDGVRIQTRRKPYYLQYHTKDVGKDNYRPFVTSEEDDYAGWYGVNISQLEIQVFLQDGRRVYDDYIVMYRVKVNGMGWLDWVSNGSQDVMYEIKNGFSLDGELDYKSTYAGWSKNEKIEALEIRVYERAALDPTPSENAVIIDAPYINQYDAGMPNGCESISAVMALQYMGVSVTPDQFVADYLDMGNAPSGGIGSDPNMVFVGDPRSSEGWGCYAPVIISALNKLSEQYSFRVDNISGQSLESLCSTYIDNGIPVLIWATVDMTDHFEYRYWTTLDGSAVEYNNKLHCLLLVGYDENSYYFNDPMRKERNGFSKSRVQEAYSLLGKQAVVITKTSGIPDEKTLEEILGIGGPYNTEKLLIDFGTTVIALKIMQTMRNIAKVFPIRNPI